jgi:hypothetical protein
MNSAPEFCNPLAVQKGPPAYRCGTRCIQSLNFYYPSDTTAVWRFKHSVRCEFDIIDPHNTTFPCVILYYSPSQYLYYLGGYCSSRQRDMRGAGKYYSWGKPTKKERGACNRERLGAHLTTDRTALAALRAGEQDFVLICPSPGLKQYCRGRRVQQCDIVLSRKRHSAVSKQAFFHERQRGGGGLFALGFARDERGHAQSAKHPTRNGRSTGIKQIGQYKERRCSSTQCPDIFSCQLKQRQEGGPLRWQEVRKSSRDVDEDCRTMLQLLIHFEALHRMFSSDYYDSVNPEHMRTKRT